MPLRIVGFIRPIDAIPSRRTRRPPPRTELTPRTIDVALARNTLSARYTASTLCVPCGSAAVLKVVVAVTEPVALRVPWPITLPFIRNATTPVGVLFWEPVTVAVSVTFDPSVAGDGDAAKATVDVRVFAPEGCTNCAKAGDVLGGIVALPRYRAVMAWPPARVPTSSIAQSCQTT
jgi:hypothetical protein